MSELKFGEIRIAAWEFWQTGLNRTREADGLTDEYGDSKLCVWQRGCYEGTGLHCSFYCSLGDWLNNISDELTDARFDDLNEDKYDILFRYYTRILKLVSEVMEDFIFLHAVVKDHRNKRGIDKGAAGTSFSQNQFEAGELKQLSDYINSVTKHKSERRHLHVCNHHLTIVFEDFGAEPDENQIRLDLQEWDKVNEDTTILIPSLKYLIEIIIRLHERLEELLEDDEYKAKLYEHYAGKYDEETE